MSQDKVPLYHNCKEKVELDRMDIATDDIGIDSDENVILQLKSHAGYLNMVMRSRLNTNSNVTDLDILMAFDEQPRLKTTKEVSDSVDSLSQRTALNRLNDLYDRGYLMKKNTGKCWVWAIKEPTWKSPLSPWIIASLGEEMDL